MKNRKGRTPENPRTIFQNIERELVVLVRYSKAVSFPTPTKRVTTKKHRDDQSTNESSGSNTYLNDAQEVEWFD